MIFLKPFLLFFLPLSLLPLIIHLLLPLKRKKILFPWIEIFKKEKEIKKRRKIKDILILIMRILAIFFVITAFSNPYIKSKYGVPENILIYNHPFWRKKIKNLKIKYLNMEKLDSLLNERKVKSIYILAPVPLSYVDKIMETKNKKIYIIGKKEYKNLKIEKVENDGKNLYVYIKSNFGVKNIPFEVYVGKNLLLRKEIDIKKGENLETFPIDFEWRNLFLKIDYKDIYPDDNKRYYYIEKIPDVSVEVIGKENKFIDAFLKTIKKGKEKIYFISGSQDLSIISKLLHKGKKVIFFPDSIDDEIEIFLRSKNINFKGKLNNLYSDDGEIFFKKFYLFESKEELKTDNFDYALFVKSKNLIVASFYPSEKLTNFMYYPDFVILLKKSIKKLLSKKLVIVEDSIYETEIENKNFSLFTYDGEKIFDYKNQGSIILSPLTSGIYFLRNSENIVVEVNPQIMPDIYNFKKKIYDNIEFIEDFKKITPLSLRKYLIILSLMSILGEVFLCLI